MFKIRPMEERDVEAADRIHRLAFGTFFGLTDPERFGAGAEPVRLRRLSYPRAALVAEKEGRLVGSILAMDWGQLFVLGPLTVDPTHWGSGAGRLLTHSLLEACGPPKAGLFTHPASVKHIRLYEGAGFISQQLSAVMSKLVAPQAMDRADASAATEGADADGHGVALLSGLAASDREAALNGIRALAQETLPGLALARELEIVGQNGLGDTILMREGAAVRGFALFHAGPGTEARGEALHVKFALASRGRGEVLAGLLRAAEVRAFELGLKRVTTGVNLARRQTYALVKNLGYRTDLLGVAMTRPDLPAYNAPDCLVLDDWR